MIKLGDKVKDVVSGFSGIAVARVHYLEGCDRVAIQAPIDKDGKRPNWDYFDEPQVKVIKKAVVKQGQTKTGGWKPDNAER